MTSVGTMAGVSSVIVAVILTAMAIARCSRFYQKELAPLPNRELPLDGLRGIAALLVAAHHSGLFYNYLHTGQWGADSNFILLLGVVGINIFFLLTGYLFWKKARNGQGEMNALKLWRGRLYRIGPVYFFSLLLMLVVAVLDNHAYFLARASFGEWVRMLSMGAFNWQSFGHVELAKYDARVMWTLAFEWRFYALLPLLAWLAVGRWTYGLASLAYLGAFLGLWRGLPWLSFVLGMVCAVVLDDEKMRARLCRPIASVVALAAMILIFVMNPESLMAAAVPGMLLPVFAVAAAGNNFFGLLTSQPLRCVGAISYSLYLLHGIIFYLVVSLLMKCGLINPSWWSYWPIMTGAAIAAVLFSAITFRWIEYPFIYRLPRTTQPIK